MANAGLVVLGILILVGTFFAANIMITPQQKNQLELGLPICNSIVGKIGGAIDPNTATQCEQVRAASELLSLQTPLYGLGGFLFLIGLIVGGGKKEVIREIIREVPSRNKAKKSEEDNEEDEEKEDKEGKFCTKCGAKVKPDNKFCNKCGAKV